MADQAPNRDRGVVIADFLGAPAAHDLSFALLATRCRAPLALVLAERLPDGVHKLHVPLIIEPSARPSRAAAVEACLQVNRALERFLRAQPGQWLWLHRRWRGGGEARAEARD
jgi:KDO2-lipid IV(A) lauroyltransferase